MHYAKSAVVYTFELKDIIVSLELSLLKRRNEKGRAESVDPALQKPQKSSLG